MVVLSFPPFTASAKMQINKKSTASILELVDIHFNVFFSKRKVFGSSPTLSAGLVCLRVCHMYFSEIL